MGKSQGLYYCSITKLGLQLFANMRGPSQTPWQSHLQKSVPSLGSMKCEAMHPKGCLVSGEATLAVLGTLFGPTTSIIIYKHP